MSGDPALRRAQTRQIALNFRNFRNLEVTSDAVRPVMAVYWGREAMTLIVCHDCTCVAAGSPVMHSFCGLLGPGTSPKKMCARNEIWTVCIRGIFGGRNSFRSIWLLCTTWVRSYDSEVPKGLMCDDDGGAWWPIEGFEIWTVHALEPDSYMHTCCIT